VLWQAARLERDDRQYPKAAEFYREAVEAASNDLAAETAIRIEFAHFLAVHAARIPDAVAMATTQLAAAQSLSSRLNLTQSEWRILYEQGILAETEDPDHAAKAVPLFRSAIARVEALRSDLSQGEQQRSVIDTETIRDLYRRTLTDVAAKETDDATFEVMERSRARSFLDALQGRRFRADPNQSSFAGTQTLDDLEKRIAALRIEIAPQNEAVLSTAGHDPAILKAELKKLEDEFQMARQQAALLKDRSSQSLAANPITLRRVRELLPAGTTLVEYGLLTDGVVALMVNRSASQRIEWKTDPVRLRKDVLRLRTLLASPDGDEWKGLLHDVSDRVTAPALKLVPAGTTRLIVVAADFLQYLPFQALETGSGDLLIDRFTVSNLPSAAVLEFLPTRSPPPRNLFLGALGNAEVEGSPRLPGTLRETASIAAIFPNSSHAYESAFTHNAVRDALLHNDAVHFATHGLLDETSPMFSALLTAGGEGQSSRFSLYELMDLHIKSRLVVLSACETGLGKVSGGDEVAGLTRSFLAAGADTVISSLWQVRDDSTAFLMAGFYRGLRAGQRPAVALRNAALRVRAKFPNPFYWAPFIVTGAG